MRYLARTTAVLLVAASSALVATTPAQAAPAVWDRVALCESSGNWSINTGNSFYGGLQFTRSTWLMFGGAAYAPYAHRATKAQQISIAQATLVGQGPGAWPVCSVRAGLTRANGAGVVTVGRTGVRVALKLVVDGRMGPLTRAAMARKHISWATTAAVKAWQTRLGVTVDGIVGRRTVAAMQVWLNAA